MEAFETMPDGYFVQEDKSYWEINRSALDQISISIEANGVNILVYLSDKDREKLINHLQVV